jgi:hypothetical protein
VRAFDPATPLHDRRERPFKPRLLGPKEFKRRNAFRFPSPKEGRAVDVCGPFEFAYWLQLEFNPDVTAITERPRKLDVGNTPVELTCWWRERSGRERFALLIPDADTIPGSDGKRRPRQLERLRNSAADAGISLELVTEDTVRLKSARVELYHHLLGFVQSAQDLKSGLVIRQEVLTLVALYPRVRVEQVTAELARLPEDSVHIVIAELIHLGAIQTDATTRLSKQSLLWRTPA